MSTAQTITKQELSEIRKKVEITDQKRRKHHKRAKLIATLGHIGFCLGLFAGGASFYYLIITLLDGAFPQWYAAIAKASRYFLPESAAETLMEFVFIAALALIGSIVFALIGQFLGLFISGKDKDNETQKNRSMQEEAENLRNSIEYNKEHYKVRWDKHYPQTDHLINRYNFIPWLTFLAPLLLGMLVADIPEDKVYFSATMVFWIPVFLTIPIVLLWKLSAVINSIFYSGSFKKNLHAELDQLNEFLAPYDKEEEERRKKERDAEYAKTAAKRKRAAEKRIQAYDAEKNGLYSLSKKLYKEAAEMGDALAMDNYARHCLIDGDRSEAIRWLQKCIDTGMADEECKVLLRALKNGEHINATYCG